MTIELPTITRKSAGIIIEEMKTLVPFSINGGPDGYIKEITKHLVKSQIRYMFHLQDGTTLYSMRDWREYSENGGPTTRMVLQQLDRLLWDHVSTEKNNG